MDGVENRTDRKRVAFRKNEIIPAHGGYRRLKSFQVSQLVFDVTVRFCDRYVDKRSRTVDQMTQAARSGVQNIAEGSKVSATSKKMEIKLTSVARASQEELKLDFEDFLRQRGLPIWSRDDPRRAGLIARRCKTADEVAAWVKEVHDRERRAVQGGPCGPGGQDGRAGPARKPATYPEIAANAALILLSVSCALLDRQIAAQAAAFEKEGGFTERLYNVRSKTRRDGSTSTPSTLSTRSKGPGAPR